MYYRAGAFKGKPISTESKEYVSIGILGFTTKHIYFHSYKVSFRIRYDKIVSISPNSNGFTILKDAVTARQQSFLELIMAFGVFVFIPVFLPLIKRDSTW